MNKRFYIKSILIAVNISLISNIATADNMQEILAVTDATNAPYELRDENGQIIGFDIDLINAIAKSQSLKIIVLPYRGNYLLDALENNDKRIIIAPLTITEERKKKLDFTIPYILPTRIAYLKPETAEKLEIKNFNDLDKGTIAAKARTTNVSALESIFGKDNPNIIGVPSQYLAMKSMYSDQTNSAFGDTAVLNYHKQFVDIPLVSFLQPLDEPVLAGFALKKGDDKLKQILDKGIKDVVANGDYEKIAKKWFGNEQAQIFTNSIKEYLKEEQ